MTRQAAARGLATHKTGPDSGSAAGLLGLNIMVDMTQPGRPGKLPGKIIEKRYHLQISYCYPSLWMEPLGAELSTDTAHNQVYMVWFKERGWRNGSAMPLKESP